MRILFALLLFIASVQGQNLSLRDPAFLARSVIDPSSINGLQRWFRADNYNQADASTLSTTWIDLSGHANATIVTGSEPTFRTNIFGTKPAIRFASAKYLTNATLTLTTNFTICSVTRNLTDFIHYGRFGSNQQVRVGRSAADVLSMSLGGGTETISTSAAIGPSTARLNVYRRSGTNIDFRINGTNISVTGNAGNTNVPTFNTLGDSINGFGAGDLGELCVWNTYLSDDSLGTLYTNYFKPTWHLPGNLLGWWKSDSFVGVTNNAPVGAVGLTAWYDSSGNGYWGVNGTAATRPIYNTSRFGSLAAVANTNTASTLTVDWPLTLTGDFTVIAVISNATSDGYVFGNSNSNRQFRINRSGANVMSFYAGGAEVISSVMATANTTTRCTTWRRSAGTVSFRENKTARSSGAEASIVVLNQFFGNTGGTGTGQGGFVGELLIYNSFVGDTDFDSFYDNYLKPRWSLP